MTADILDRAAAAALALAADKPAEPDRPARHRREGGCPSRRYALADSKAAVLALLSTRFRPGRARRGLS